MIRPVRASLRASVILALGYVAISAISAMAADDPVPVPRLTIYPGDQITDDMLEEKSFRQSSVQTALVFLTRNGLVGKVARRTLLPGQPIATNAVDNPRIVTVGSQVRIIFSEGGMQITTYGVAQQPGALGDVIRVRNTESGLFVSGRVQADGSILVGDG